MFHIAMRYIKKKKTVNGQPDDEYFTGVIPPQRLCITVCLEIPLPNDHKVVDDE